KAEENKQKNQNLTYSEQQNRQKDLYDHWFQQELARGRQLTQQINSRQTSPQFRRSRSLSTSNQSQLTARVTEHKQSRIIIDKTDEFDENTSRLYWDRSITQ
ncbi:2917_t:CDS:2, partial [Ambispora gerdemannii]